MTWAMIALSYAQKKDQKNLFNITSECGTTFAGLVGVVVATPDLHDQPPVERRKQNVIAKLKMENQLQVKGERK
jgi:hypothetical protein